MGLIKGDARSLDYSSFAHMALRKRGISEGFHTQRAHLSTQIDF